MSANAFKAYLVITQIAVRMIADKATAKEQFQKLSPEDQAFVKGNVQGELFLEKCNELLNHIQEKDIDDEIQIVQKQSSIQEKKGNVGKKTPRNMIEEELTYIEPEKSIAFEPIANNNEQKKGQKQTKTSKALEYFVVIGTIAALQNIVITVLQRAITNDDYFWLGFGISMGVSLIGCFLSIWLFIHKKPFCSLFDSCSECQCSRKKCKQACHRFWCCCCDKKDVQSPKKQGVQMKQQFVDEQSQRTA